MTNNQLGGLIGCAAMIAAGQVLFKWAALTAARQSAGAPAAIEVLRVPSFWAALVIYGAATLFWTYILQSVPLSRAYPFMAMGFVIVPVFAALLFGEKLNASYLIGAALISCGIVLTVRA